jgi:transcriptional regulator with GAF, ATPase, and Fis domain
MKPRFFALIQHDERWWERAREQGQNDEIELVRTDTLPERTELLVVASSAPSARELLKHPRLAPTFVVLPSVEETTTCELLTLGAEDVFSTDEDFAQHSTYLARVAERWHRARACFSLPLVREKLVGSSATWLLALKALIETGLDPGSNVLLSGETGTGKEAAARLIHDLGFSSRGNFVVVNAAAIVETLSGSELFGHRRGAFTGAERDRDGAVALANGGTLFLDEVGELKPPLQAELLRVLEDGTYRPVGDDRTRSSRFRLIAATHRDLPAMVERQLFRADLYHRIAGRVCKLPSLRERPDDIPELVQHFLAQSLAIDAPPLDQAVVRCLRRASYPGNVRELRGLVQRIATRYHGSGPVRLCHLPRESLAGMGALEGTRDDLRRAIGDAVNGGAKFSELVETVKDMIIQTALEQSQGSASEAGRLIDVSKRWVELRRRGSRRSEALDCEEVAS